MFCSEFYDAVGKEVDQLSRLMCEKYGYDYAAGFLSSSLRSIVTDHELDLSDAQKKRVLELIVNRIDYIENKA